MVNGTTATIPVSLTDNDRIGQLKHLTLRLEGGAGYQLGAGTAATITIEENDADWQGAFITADAALGFVLATQQSNGVYQASLKGGGTGFFPTNEIPADITFTANNFSVTATNVVVDASASLLNAPANLTLILNAMNGVTNQSVSTTQVEGVATLITKYAGLAHLNTTNLGTFLLLKPPVAPSTNEVQLVNVP
jgi:hypothetical protein